MLTEGGKRSDEELDDLCHRFLYSHLPTWQWIMQYDTAELQCSVFGHVCPVFFVAEGFTETREGRRMGRRVPHDIMLKVVRRDGQICQICQLPVPDNEVEFDHVIPLSRGGPLTSENIRLVCRPCNRKKRDTLTELLENDGALTRGKHETVLDARATDTDHTSAPRSGRRDTKAKR